LKTLAGTFGESILARDEEVGVSPKPISTDPTTKLIQLR
jgi:hypothetical protein